MTTAEGDFKETRRCLLNSYHTYLQNHVGYMIAIVIGFVGLVSAYSDFFVNIQSNYVYIILIGAVFGVVTFYNLLRIEYWSYYAATSIFLPRNDAITYFDNYPSNRKYRYPKESPIPNTAILQIAINGHLWNIKNHAGLTGRIWLWCVLRTGGKPIKVNL